MDALGRFHLAKYSGVLPVSLAQPRCPLLGLQKATLPESVLHSPGKIAGKVVSWTGMLPSPPRLSSVLMQSEPSHLGTALY